MKRGKKADVIVVQSPRLKHKERKKNIFWEFIQDQVMQSNTTNTKNNQIQTLILYTIIP